MCTCISSSFSMSISFALCLLVCVSVCMAAKSHRLSVYLFLCLCLSTLLYVSLLVNQLVSQSISVRLRLICSLICFVCLITYLSVCVSVCLTVCLLPLTSVHAYESPSDSFTWFQSTTEKRRLSHVKAMNYYGSNNLSSNIDKLIYVQILGKFYIFESIRSDFCWSLIPRIVNRVYSNMWSRLRIVRFSIFVRRPKVNERMNEQKVAWTNKTSEWIKLVCVSEQIHY